VQRIERKLGQSLTVALDGCGRFCWAHALDASTRERLVGTCGLPLPGYFVLGQTAHYFAWNTCNQAARRNDGARSDTGGGGYEARFTDDRAIHDNSVHAYQRIPADSAAMKNGAMTYVTIRLNDSFCTGEAVHHDGILHIASRLQNQATEVSAQTGTRSNIAVRPNDDVAYEHSGGMHESRRIYDWHDSIDRVDLRHRLRMILQQYVASVTPRPLVARKRSQDSREAK
jgi:hypothetical protein